jgi:hypothetical protein
VLSINNIYSISRSSKHNSFTLKWFDLALLQSGLPRGMCLLVRIEEFVVLFLWLLCLVAIISLVLFLLKMLIPARLLELCARFRTIVITCLHRFWLTDLGWLLLLMMFWSLWYLLLNLLCLHFIFCDWHILSSFEFGFFDLFFMLSLIYFLFYFSEELLNFIECLLEK